MITLVIMHSVFYSKKKKKERKKEVNWDIVSLLVAENTVTVSRRKGF